MTPHHVSRRRLLQGGATLLGGAALGAAAASTISESDAEGPEPTHGGDVVPFFGAHQAGVETSPPAHTWFVGLDVVPETNQAALERLMRLWTDDAARLTQGHGALADQEAELAANPSRLTVTVGVGPTLFSTHGLQDRRPESLRPIPRFPIDRLEAPWGQTDLLLQVGSDDLVAVSHSVRVMTRDARAFARVRWTQKGFIHARGTRASGTTPRNLLGQVDGTVNPAPGSPEFDSQVWMGPGAAGWSGGTLLVLRRIRLELDSWERIGRSDREQIIGRRIADGAPLTGGDERTTPDLAATERGLPVIPDFAHIRRARATTPAERFLRRGYSYDDTTKEGAQDAGLLFAAYMADIDRQYLPVQRRLVELDLLNRWTTPIGSSVFGILPGCSPGGWIGEAVLG